MVISFLIVVIQERLPSNQSSSDSMCFSNFQEVMCSHRLFGAMFVNLGRVAYNPRSSRLFIRALQAFTQIAMEHFKKPPKEDKLPLPIPYKDALVGARKTNLATKMPPASTPNTPAIRPAAVPAKHTATNSSSLTTTVTTKNDADRVDTTQKRQQGHEPTVRETSTLLEPTKSSATLVIRPRSFRSFVPVFPGRHFAPVSQGASLSSLRDPAADIDNTPVLGLIARPIRASSSATLILGLEASSGTTVPNASTTTNTSAQLSQHCTAAEDAIKRLEDTVIRLYSQGTAVENATKRLEENVATLSSLCMAADNLVERLDVNVTVLSHLSDTLRTPCQAHQNSTANTGETTQEVNNDLYEVPQEPTISSQDPGSSTSESGTTMNTPAPNRELRQVLHDFFAPKLNTMWELFRSEQKQILTEPAEPDSTSTQALSD
jgi:hypothetical protein